MTNIVVNSNRYEALLKAEKELDALHAGGVDNWEWYYESLRNAGLLAPCDDRGWSE